MLRKSAVVAALPLVLGAVLAGCDGPTGPGGSNQPEPLKSLPRALSATEQQTLAASNQFAFGLLREVSARDTSRNVFVSPLSATMALGMTMNGARGTTLDGMRTALGFGTMSLQDIDASYRSLIDLLKGLDSGIDFRLANSIWAKQGFPFEQSFYDATRTYFDAQLTALDFADPKTVGTINAWVKDKTGGKIDGIVDQIPPEAVMYLINAVYFKGSWRDKFDASKTADAQFTRSDGSKSTVKMMHRQGDATFFQATGVRGVELPYGRGAYVMTLVLPDPGTRLADVVAGLDAAKWNQWLASGHTAEVQLGLPRFKLSWSSGLNAPLIALGMGTAFSPGLADFRGMSPAGDKLYISSVKQKTFVDVNEEGTEAAAATSVEISLTSMPQTVTLTFDRPFLLAIREKFSGAILFLGAIGAPESQ